MVQTPKRAARTTAESKPPMRAARVAADSKPPVRAARPGATKQLKRATAGSTPPKRKPRTIDDYLDGVSPDQRTVLERLRRTVRAVAPAAEECISYGLAAFRLEGKLLVGFGATRQHCAFYPLSGSTIAAYQKQLRAFKTTKGSIQFSPEQPLGPALVRTLTRARIAENRR